MKNLVVAQIGLFLALIKISVSQCPSTRQLSYSSCVFKIDYADGSCTNFSFRQCSFVVCLLRGTYRCLQEQTRNSSSWSQCTSQCCNQDIQYPQTSESLDQCQDFIETSFVRNLVISISVVVSFFLFLIVCCCCRYNVCSYCNCCIRRFRRRLNPYDQAAASANNMGVINNSIQETNQQLTRRWKLVDKRDNKFEDNCSICLDSKPCLQLGCGHVFHRYCIIEALRHNRECALCRRKDVFWVKVYCQKCLNLIQQVRNLMNKHQLCDQCVKNQL